jgi:2-amino-4-hydroxy-6-hydroxymethyldihydropteridine diphosphokinase
LSSKDFSHKDNEKKVGHRIGTAVTAYLSLGSNIGDKKNMLESAIASIGNTAEVTVENISSFYVTEPVDGSSGDNFLNCAVEIETTLEPLDLLDTIEEIEVLHGRTAKASKKPRTLDIDIILYGGMVVAFPRLKVPHPRMAERKFVLEPLGQIAPELRHPTLNMTSAELVKAIPNQTPLCKRLDST